MTPFERLVETLAAQAFTRQAFVQVAIVAAALVLGFFLARYLRVRVGARASRWKFGEGGFDRVSSPLAALALAFLGKVTLRWEQTPILDLAITLLAAMAVIRFAVYVLRHILPPGAFLNASERTIAWLMWVGAVFYVVGLLPEMAAALDRADITIGKQRISLLLVMQAAASIAVTLAISLWVARIIESRVLANEAVEMSTRVVVAKLVRAVAFFAVILVALPVVGIDITALSVFGGALGVGLGFGLQKIASNYVSGFIILLDRSVRIGDLVTVDGRHGTVQEIASRYTVVRSADGTESIIPNELLITHSVTNYSYTDRRAQVKVLVVVAHDADLDLVFQALAEAARDAPGVAADPRPLAAVTRVVEYGIEVELAAWMEDAHLGQGGLRSDLYRAIFTAFRRHGIELPRKVGFTTGEIQETSTKSMS